MFVWTVVLRSDLYYYAPRNPIWRTHKYNITHPKILYCVHGNPILRTKESYTMNEEILYYALGTCILCMPESYIMRAEPVYYTCRYSSLLHIIIYYGLLPWQYMKKYILLFDCKRNFFYLCVCFIITLPEMDLLCRCRKSRRGDGLWWCLILNDWKLNTVWGDFFLFY